MNNIPRCEHPNPQFMRDNWLCLNGEWQFTIDNERSGVAKKFFEDDVTFDSKIIVPFCPESKLSGLAHTDFMNAVWYKRTLDLTEAQLNSVVRLNFGAVDYKASVYVNGTLAATHKGGYTPFYVDINSFAKVGANIITVYAEDSVRCPMVPRGKQSEEYYSHGCDYTRTTGIWQSVWVEFIPKTHIEKIRIYPDVKGCGVTIEASLNGKSTLTAKALYNGADMGEASCESEGNRCTLYIKLSEKHLWEVGNGRLYDLELTYGDDTVHTYFGLREVALDGYKFRINGKSVFQRLILDQGFYPDGIYTAPDDSELLADIKRSLDCGFNGARLHQKIFEPRFLYHADKEGYIVWGEYPNWGLDHTDGMGIYFFLPEWLEEIERDFNHPSIVGWCPFNETWDINNRRQYDDLLRMIYLATKSADTTRPCIDTSGNYHVVTDIFDVHDYEQKPDVFKERYDVFAKDGKELYTHFPDRQTYTPGMPAFVSEYGGIKWSPDRNDGWGYGDAPKTEEEFIERYKGLTDALLDNPYMFAFCYTQLTDIEQEQNGLYTYDRKPKFDLSVIHAITSRKAAIED